MRYGKYQITETERAEREENVTQALAILRLEGQTPGPNGLALFREFVNGNYTYEECLEERKKVAILDLKLQDEESRKQFQKHSA